MNSRPGEEPTMFVQEFTRAGLVTRVIVSHEFTGWQLREERGGAVVSDAHFNDWHRLERALRSIEMRFQSGDLKPLGLSR